jgi:hypothetical protein
MQIKFFLSRQMFAVSIIVTLFITPALSATLVWNDGSGTIEGYKVHYGTSSTNPHESIKVGTTTSYSLDKLSLSEGTQYFFSVSAYNAAGESDPCAPVAYTPSDTTPPSPPAGLVAE